MPTTRTAQRLEGGPFVAPSGKLEQPPTRGSRAWPTDCVQLWFPARSDSLIGDNRSTEAVPAPSIAAGWLWLAEASASEHRATLGRCQPPVGDGTATQPIIPALVYDTCIVWSL